MEIVEEEILIISSYEYMAASDMCCMPSLPSNPASVLSPKNTQQTSLHQTDRAGKLLLKTCWNTSLAWCQKCVCLSNLQLGGHGCGIPFIKGNLAVENPGETYLLLFFPCGMGTEDPVERMSRRSLQRNEICLTLLPFPTS